MVTRRTDVPEDEGQRSREGIGVQQVSRVEAIRLQGSLTECQPLDEKLNGSESEVTFPNLS